MNDVADAKTINEKIETGVRARGKAKKLLIKKNREDKNKVRNKKTILQN